MILHKTLINISICALFSCPFCSLYLSSKVFTQYYINPFQIHTTPIYHRKSKNINKLINCRDF